MHHVGGVILLGFDLVMIPCFLSRANEQTASEVPADADTKSCDPAKDEEMGTTWSRDEKDPERYLHRIRH